MLHNKALWADNGLDGLVIANVGDPVVVDRSVTPLGGWVGFVEVPVTEESESRDGYEQHQNKDVASWENKKHQRRQ